MHKVNFVKVDLKAEKTFTGRDAEKIRGHIGQRFADDINFHNHGPEGFKYGYPLVQYKVIARKPMLVGLMAGVESIWRVFREVDGLVLDGVQVHVLEKSMIASEAVFGDCDNQITYRFRTPWYPLSQNNYLKYRKIDSRTEKSKFLKKILIGNLLSMAKALDVFVERKILVSNISIFPKAFRLDNVRVLGFLGTFSVNFEIPDCLGIGKSVARGLGAVTKINNSRLSIKKTHAADN